MFGNAKNRLLIMLMLTTIFFMVEIIVGYITNSMALIADSFHMFSDAVALVIAYISVHMSPKKWSKNTFGWARAEILGALINSVFLCALCFSILIESVKRFVKPDFIHEPHLLLAVGGLGLFINLIGLVMFKDGGHHHHHHGHGHGHNHGHNHSHHQEHSHESSLGHSHQRLSDKDEYLVTNESGDNCDSSAEQLRQHDSQQMNMRGVFLHVMADALGSVIVMISALTVIYTDWTIKMYIDPTLSVFMVCLVLKSTWPLLIESAMILLQTVPTTIEVDSLKKKLTQEIPGVLAVHEFHIWRLAGDRIIASAHIRCHNLQDYMRIAQKVKEFFHNEGIHSTTIQPEFTDFDEDVNNLQDGQYDDDCALDCPTAQRTTCLPQTCCGVKRSSQSTSSNMNSTRMDQLGSVTVGFSGLDNNNQAGRTSGDNISSLDHPRAPLNPADQEL